MEGTPAESHATLHPQLRQKMLNRAATVAEGTLPLTSPRRRSSLVSNLSESRYSLRSSTDNLLRTSGKDDMNRHASLDEPSQWIALPVVAAVVPAIIGLTVENGAAIATDLFILLLAGWFLHWSVKVPWEWYRDAQQRLYVNDHDQVDDTCEDTIVEEDGEDRESLSSTQLDALSEPQADDRNNTSAALEEHKEAREALKRAELLAFVGCFLGPLLGALLVHTIRGQLMRAEGIVSDANLSIFLLMAEIPPENRLIKMRTEHILHLQRIVREAPREPIRSTDAQQLSQRLAELEDRLAGVRTPNQSNHQAEFEKISTEVRQTTQLQLDGLTRAVRRCEKRHLNQTAQYDSHFHDLEARLNDTLALAAAAARTGQKPGLVATMLSWIASTISSLVQIFWDIAVYPFRTAAIVCDAAKSIFVKDQRQLKGRPKGRQMNGYTALSTSRMQAKLGK